MLMNGSECDDINGHGSDSGNDDSKSTSKCGSRDIQIYDNNYRDVRRCS